MIVAAVERAVIIMCKRPAPGATKTRLMPALTAQQAADFYECLLSDTLRGVQARADCTAVLALDAPESADYFAIFAPEVATVLQEGPTLGHRLDAVLTECLKHGHASVFAISSDSPDLPATHLDEAFRALETDDVDIVLGPTEDGGYYLIGWKQRWEPVVTEVTMSTPHVLTDTLAIAQSLGARVHLAPEWYDIDTPDDLDRLRKTPHPWQAPRSLAFLTAR